MHQAVFEPGNCADMSLTETLLCNALDCSAPAYTISRIRKLN